MKLNQKAAVYLAASVAFAGMCSVSAKAAGLSLTDIGQGWIAQNGATNHVGTSNDYLVGNCGQYDCGVGEYRNFFEFSIPTSPTPYTSATLSLLNGLMINRQTGKPDPTFTLTSLSSFTFATLGTGTVYGSRTFTTADNKTTVDMALNSAALATIGYGGGEFDLGGRVTSAALFGPSQPDLLIFGYNASAATLTLATGTSIAEPAGWLTLLIGLAGMGVARHRRGRRPSQ